MKDSTTFNQIVNSYEQLWRSNHAHELDLGGKSYLDQLYASILKSDDFFKIMNNNSCIIDLGAGMGSKIVRELSACSPQIIAVDCFPSFVDLPLRYNAKKIISNILETDLPDNCADLVVSAYVATHNPYFVSDENQKKYADEIIRLLKPGGIFWGEEKDLNQHIFKYNKLIEEYTYLYPFYVHFFKKI
ncbi:MAG: hypothetical protein A2Y40_10975 [Candidatus Margulisbacteria bacterium GWF2_35_9]|nr:MAG: hypothetical protein A2Y40_10975 [Candidatus Margulisbacteria bacterium GWF2_35_9]